MTTYGFEEKRIALHLRKLARRQLKDKRQPRKPLPWSPRGYVAVPNTTITAASYSGSRLVAGLGTAWLLRRDVESSGSVTLERQLDELGDAVEKTVYNLNFEEYAGIGDTDAVDEENPIILVNEDAWGDYYVVDVPNQVNSYLAQSPAGGIAAISGTTPGSATCTFYEISGGTLTSLGFSKTVYNIASAVAASTYIKVSKTFGGIWVVDVEDCS